MADGELFLEDLQAAIHRAFEEGIEPAALLLHPSTVIHVSDPTLGLEPLGASEIDAIDTVPIRRAAAWLNGFSTLFEQEAHHGSDAS